MRVAAVISLCAIASGVAARPVPNAEAAPEPAIWSWRCGLFDWRCPPSNNVEPEPTTSEPPQPTTSEQPEPTTSEQPEPTTSEQPEPTTSEQPEPTSQEPEPTSENPKPSTSQAPPPTPSGCLTPDFCPDTSGGQGGNPPDGSGTITYPNGTRPPSGVGRRDAEADSELEMRYIEHEERNTHDLTPFME